MSGRRLLALLTVFAVIAVWGGSLASASGGGSARSFEINYTGTGELVSRTKTITSPQCGEVTEVRNEDTHFSWVTDYKVTLGFGGHGFSSATATRVAQSSPLVSNDSSVKFSDTGCQTGLADCHGASEPQPGQKAVLSLSGAGPGGSSRLKAQAVGGFVGFYAKDFSGAWSNIAGSSSCASYFTTVKQLLQPEFGVPAELEANFPVRFATMQSLPVGHYFKVHITAGHYAEAHRDNCFASDGCLKDDFSWSGYVRVTRVS